MGNRKCWQRLPIRDGNQKWIDRKRRATVSAKQQFRVSGEERACSRLPLVESHTQNTQSQVTATAAIHLIIHSVF